MCLYFLLSTMKEDSEKAYKSRKRILSLSATNKLIEIVREHPCIWDPSNPEYHDRVTIAETWEKIANIMNLPLEPIKMKWKNLRDMYIKIIRKWKTREAYRGHWKHFDQLSYIIYRPQTEDSEDSDETNGVDTFYDDETPLSEVSIKLEGHEHASSEEDPIVHVPEKKRKETTHEEDYDLMFLKSLIPYFKELSSMRKLVVRSRIQDLLMNELAAQKNEGFKRVMGDI